MWTDSLRQFHFWCQKTLPLVYDDSLSYYEVLAKLTKHLNELTTLVNEIGDELERYEGVTDSRLDTLETWRTEVDTWRAQIDEWKADVNTWIEQTDAWKQSTENHLTAHDNWISYATGLINNTIMPFIDDMTTRVGNIENRLSSAEDDIDALEGRMDTAESDIDSLQSDVTSLDGRLDDAESNITSLDGRLDTAESNITSLDGRLDTAESDITSLDGRLDTAESDIDSLQSDVTSLDGRLDSAESNITSLDSRLDTVEDDIDTLQSDTTGLANRMSTAEDGISKIEERAFIIFGIVTYDSTNNIWLLEIGSSWDATFIRTNVDNSDYLLSAVSKKTQFVFSIGSSGYNYDNLVLSYGLTPLQYNSQNVVINISSPGTNSIWYKDFDNSGDTFILDTMPSNFAKINRLVSSNTLSIPRPTQNDDGKVVSYNDTTKNYELITPSGGSSSHTYSTTEQEVGVWIDGTTKVYEKTVSGRRYSADVVLDIGITPTLVISADVRVRVDASGSFWEYHRPVLWNGNTIVVTGSGGNSNWHEAVGIIRYTKT